jgi:hypothetical protein
VARRFEKKRLFFDPVVVLETFRKFFEKALTFTTGILTRRGI